jgi:thioredoxin-like negative regulator of GroEL
MKQDPNPITTAFPPTVVVAGVDGKATPGFRRQFSVDAAPSVLLFDSGNCQLTLTGYHSAEQITTTHAEVYGTR